VPPLGIGACWDQTHDCRTLEAGLVGFLHPLAKYEKDIGPLEYAVPAKQEQGEPVALDMTLDEAAVEMLNAFSSPSPHLNDYSKLRLMLGEGHSGYGLYLSLAEYPEEGSELLVNTTPPYVPTERQRKPLTDDEIWKNDNIMAANSGYGADFETLRQVIRAIEAAHGIKGAA